MNIQEDLAILQGELLPMAPKAIVVSIGNSDNKLTQVEWSEFVGRVNTYLVSAGHVHFFGGSATYERWQNVVWWVDIPVLVIPQARFVLSGIAKVYKQDSIALLVGDTEFIRPIQAKEIAINDTEF